jgi:hypothetical protein
VNKEDRRGRSYKLDLGDSLPEERQILPTVEELAATKAPSGKNRDTVTIL